jgi:hypothetical protein
MGWHMFRFLLETREIMKVSIEANISELTPHVYYKQISIGKNPGTGNFFQNSPPKDRRGSLRILLKTSVLGGEEIAVTL